MTENKYQAQIIKKLKAMFPGCMIMKSDPDYQQGIPDLIILWEKYWATLEIKTSRSASTQPNQRHFIERLDKMSFAAFIYPENEEEVLFALQQAFKPPGRTRLLKS